MMNEPLTHDTCIKLKTLSQQSNIEELEPGEKQLRKHTSLSMNVLTSTPACASQNVDSYIQSPGPWTSFAEL